MLLILFFATIASAVTLKEQNSRLLKTNKILLQTLQEISGESEVSVSANQVDECSTGATYQELQGIWAHDVAVVTYSGLTEIEKDASCCKQCAARSDCEFWVRATDSTQCWLKSNSGAEIHPTNHGHRRGGVKAGKWVHRKSDGICFNCNHFGRRLLTEEK